MSFLFAHSHAPAKVSHTHGHGSGSGVFSSPLEGSVVGEAVKAVAVGAPIGAFFGAGKAWWFKYPLGQGVGIMGVNTALVGGLAGIYMATNTLVAQARHKDDVWNAPYAGFVTGLAAGARAGSPQKIVFFSVAFSGLALWGKFFSTELKENFSFNRYEKKHNAPPVFVGNERDPYKERWAKIQAREEAAADEE